MVRSALAALALAVLPSVAHGQGDPNETTAFSRDDLYRAHWLAELEADPPHTGHVASVVDQGDSPGTRRSARPFDRVVIGVEGTSPRVGAQLHTFRVRYQLEGIGQVVTPTGVLTVVEVTGGRVVAQVDKLYHLMEVGDLVGELPPFPLQPGAEAEAVAGAMQVEIIGFGEQHAIQFPGHYLFLASGSSAGVGVGDVFDVVWPGPVDDAQQWQGQVQVVRVAPEYATARIIWLTNPVFYTGVMVRLSGRMR